MLRTQKSDQLFEEEKIKQKLGLKLNEILEVCKNEILGKENSNDKLLSMLNKINDEKLGEVILSRILEIKEIKQHKDFDLFSVMYIKHVLNLCTYELKYEKVLNETVSCYPKAMKLITRDNFSEFSPFKGTKILKAITSAFDQFKDDTNIVSFLSNTIRDESNVYVQLNAWNAYYAVVKKSDDVKIKDKFIEDFLVLAKSDIKYLRVLKYMIEIMMETKAFYERDEKACLLFLVKNGNKVVSRSLDSLSVIFNALLNISDLILFNLTAFSEVEQGEIRNLIKNTISSSEAQIREIAEIINQKWKLQIPTSFFGSIKTYCTAFFFKKAQYQPIENESEEKSYFLKKND